MSDFDTIGFLSSEVDKQHNEIKSAYPEQYALTMKVNTFCQGLQYELEFHTDSNDQILAATLFARSVSTYQAFIILLLKGMQDQASMVLRCLMECVFLLVAISKNPGYSEKIAKSDQAAYKKSRNKLKRFLERHNPNHSDLSIIEDQIQEVSQVIADHNCKQFRISDIAKDADLEDWYDIVYSVLCEAVHSSPRSLEELLAIEDNKITCLRNHPRSDDLDPLFITGLNIMLFSIEAISSILNKDTIEFTGELRKTLPAFRKP